MPALRNIPWDGPASNHATEQQRARLTMLFQALQEAYLDDVAPEVWDGVGNLLVCAHYMGANEQAVSTRADVAAASTAVQP